MHKKFFILITTIILSSSSVYAQNRVDYREIQQQVMQKDRDTLADSRDQRAAKLERASEVITVSSLTQREERHQAAQLRRRDRLLDHYASF
ncbi:MAG: hypothetical protein DSZ05_09130 [Sulfurospirillum sp.]|nr:MAG: hypothetical protein DSZ05_09130 [Sulfurospirillum sp.]